MSRVLRGVAHKYGDNVDTDAIIPARYLTSNDPFFLGQHAMEGIDRDFLAKVREGDFIVAGRNFGCGSSREHAVDALYAAGVRAVIAISFARIFYRNSIGSGHLYPIEVTNEIIKGIEPGDVLELNLDENQLTDMRTEKVYVISGFPDAVRSIIEAGGLTQYNKKRLST